MEKFMEGKAQDPFWFRECFVMVRPVGVSVVNLRELLHAMREVPEQVLFYHLFQSRLTLFQPTVEYPNDFAHWAATALQDIRLAEKLSSFDPFDANDLEEVRQGLVDVLEEYLWDLTRVPWSRPGFEFHFCEGATVVMRSKLSAWTMADFCEGLKKVGTGSVYFHLLESRWRLGPKETDDFSFWIESNFGMPELVDAIRGLDVYFHSLGELKTRVLHLVELHSEGRQDEQ